MSAADREDFMSWSRNLPGPPTAGPSQRRRDTIYLHRPPSPIPEARASSATAATVQPDGAAIPNVPRVELEAVGVHSVPRIELEAVGVPSVPRIELEAVTGTESPSNNTITALELGTVPPQTNASPSPKTPIRSSRRLSPISRSNAVTQRRSRPISQAFGIVAAPPSPPLTEPATSPSAVSARFSHPTPAGGHVDAATQTGENISLAGPEPTQIHIALDSPALPQAETLVSAISEKRWSNERTKSDGSRKNSKLAAKLTKEKETLEATNRILEARISALEEENRVLKDRLLPHAKSISTDGEQERNADDEKEKEDDEHVAQKGHTRGNSSGDFANLVSGWIDTMHDRQRLFVERLTLWEDKRALEKKVVDLNNRVHELEETVTEQNDILQALVDDVKAAHPNRNFDALPKERGLVPAFQQYWSNLKRTAHLVTQLGISPRVILLCKMMQLQTPAPDTTRKRLELTRGFDVPMEIEQAVAYNEVLNARHVRLVDVATKICTICKLPKFVNAPSPASISTGGIVTLVNEFHPHFGITSCCLSPVCNACLPSAIMRSVQADWWLRLASDNWICCPVPNCTATIPIRYNIELNNFLQSIGDPNALAHVQQFDRANSLRTALETGGGGVLPTKEACRIAEALHTRLVKHKVMYPLFDSRAGPYLAVQMLPVNSQSGKRTLSVPIFTSLFKRMAVGKECGVCAETIPDINIESEAVWRSACKGFSGDWTWAVRAFPAPSLVPTCASRHELDICRGCIARHLATRLDALGRSVTTADGDGDGANPPSPSTSLLCPSPDCGHAYSDDELKALASADTFARYDKLRLLAHLAALPNFRWCLREGCENGQIYDTEPDGSTMIWPNTRTPPIQNKIACGACGFAMCFAHQTPWHEGLLCRAFDSERTPEYAATREWLAGNTKKCPGPRCGVFVEKKGGCFHMTCRECKFEFCWECLADWKQIYRHGTYHRSAHKDGCYFRAEGARLPTHVMGNTIEEAAGVM